MGAGAIAAAAPSRTLPRRLPVATRTQDDRPRYEVDKSFAPALAASRMRPLRMRAERLAGAPGSMITLADVLRRLEADDGLDQRQSGCARNWSYRSARSVTMIHTWALRASRPRSLAKPRAHVGGQATAEKFIELVDD